jgi:SAM-dependent methyltransferase
VREASLSFKGKPQSVLVADAASLPFESGSFDVVTSLETLEHLDARDRFLAEIRRVLAVTGLCVLSTPNALVTEPIDGKPRNRFHRHEYTPDELTTSLRCHFRSVDLVGQALNGRYAIPPFWDDQQRLPRTPTVQARLFGWRVLNKLPFAVRDAISQALWHQPFIPTERDYDFDADVVTAPVLVAICRDFAT